MMTALDVATELTSADPVKRERLGAQTAAIQRITDEVLQRQAQALEEEEKQATPFTRRVLEEMTRKHLAFNQMVLRNAREGRLSQQAYGRYLIQAWYHTQFTPQFERLFGERLKQHVEIDPSQFDTGNKFIRMIEEGADEELGHELWALEDLQRLGGPAKIDILRDVFPETRALVCTQFDRLSRLDFKGFLGYSFYLEYWVAKYGGSVLKTLGLPKQNTSFLHNHHVIDQGHAADNIELVNFLIRTEDDLNEVLDNLEIIYCLYYRMIEKCFD
jgi:hypothetical protein